MIRLVIWDFDGPVFNSRNARDVAFARVDEHFSQEVGACSFDYSALPLFDPRQTVRWAYADKDLPAGVLDQIEARYRVELSQAEATVVVDRSIIEAIESLLQLQCKLAILSLRSEKGLKHLLQTHRLARYFSIVHGRETPPASKPSKEAVLSILRQAGATQGETILIGDSDHDFKAAHDSGIPYFHAGWSTEPVSVARQAYQILVHPSEVELIVAHGLKPLPSSEQARKDLSNIVRSEKFSFFTGAGVSIASGLGSWRSCYYPILNKHLPESLLNGFSLPEIIQMIVVDDRRAHLLFDDFRAAFTSQREPNSYHFAIMRSACDTIWTTNYDNLFERVPNAPGGGVPVLRDDAQLKDYFGSGRKLIKVNGDFYAASFKRSSLDWGVVISDEQFDLSEVQRPEIWRYFEDEYRTSSLIFVGVSFADPTLRRILSIISRKVMRTRKPHFVLALEPQAPSERVIVAMQIEVLRQRNINTLLFDDYAAIAEFVSEICMSSRKPVITFLGTAYQSSEHDAAPEVEVEDARLDDGILSFHDIEKMCGDLGVTLARAGFRVASGAGARIGIPAVAKAYEEDRRAARYYMRKHGATRGSRLAPTIFFSVDTLDEVRQKLLQSSHVVVAIGGASRRGSESGTVTEVRMALNMGRPVILFPQGGGDVAKCYDELIMMSRSLIDPHLRDEVIRVNQSISTMDRTQVLAFVEHDFLPSVRSLVRNAMVSPYSTSFDDACVEADKEW
jgi:HAD superfamily hydrolase (TIGR01549 family)